MPENFELFNEEIEEIKSYSELPTDVFSQICNEAKRYLSSYGNYIAPSVVVDLIESAVSIYMLALVQAEQGQNINSKITTSEAVKLAFEDLGLVEEKSLSTKR